MKTVESQGFFCVVYFSDTKKTAYYHKVWNPSKLANYLSNKWKWIKIYKDKEDYYTNPKANNYYAIFNEENTVHEFSFHPFVKK